MSYQTNVVWNQPMDQATIDAITAYANTPEILAEQVQPVQVIGIPGPGENQTTKIRYWIEEPSAVNWVNFVLQYNPVSTEIIPQP